MLTAPQQAFCEAYVISQNGTEAYLKAYPKSSKAAARRSASDLLTIPDIKAEIERLRAPSSKRARLTRENALQFCIDVITSAPAEAGMDNPLCELKMSKAGPFAAFPDKMAALARLAKMMPGWDAPEQVENKIEIVVRKL